MTALPTDIILFAIMAVVLLFHFNSILNKNNDTKDSVKGSNAKLQNKAIKTAPKINASNMKDANILEIEKVTVKDALEKINPSVKKGLKEISELDNSFKLDNFVTGAIKAFGLIVFSYTKGRLDVLKELLNEELFDVFKDDIKKRKKDQVIDTKIEKINKIHISKAKLKGSMAYVTVEFTSQQTTAVRDKNGKVLKGDPEQPREIKDIWTFARDTRTDNPNWVLFTSEA